MSSSVRNGKGDSASRRKQDILNHCSANFVTVASHLPTGSGILLRMLSTLCPFCERLSHMTLVWGRIHDEGQRARVAATCDNCSNLSVARGQIDYGRYANDTTDLAHVARAINGYEDELEWWPKSGATPEVKDVPDGIARAAREAYSSASVNNHMAAILMARTVVEATAKAKAITNGNLASKINALRDQGFIRPAIAEQAHEVRFMGNDMAHGDIDEAPDAIDSEEILALMGEVLSEVFQGPARLARIRNRRETRS